MPRVNTKYKLKTLFVSRRTSVGKQDIVQHVDNPILFQNQIPTHFLSTDCVSTLVAVESDSFGTNHLGSKFFSDHRHAHDVWDDVIFEQSFKKTSRSSSHLN